MNFKLPITNTIDVIIGDIYVDVDIKFRPVSIPYETISKISIDNFNHRLGGLAYEIKEKVKEIIETTLSEGNKL